jgi:hypothetical protein
MKLWKLSLFMVLVVAACLPAAAQSPVMRVNIPFDFIADGKLLPAGHYMVLPVWQGSQKAWRISNENDKFSVSMITNAVESPSHPHHRSLVFLEAGGPKLLVELWPEAHSGRGVPKSTVKQTLVAGAGKQVEVAAE